MVKLSAFTVTYKNISILIAPPKNVCAMMDLHLKITIVLILVEMEKCLQPFVMMGISLMETVVLPHAQLN